jgi:hypothetical protein
MVAEGRMTWVQKARRFLSGSLKGEKVVGTRLHRQKTLESIMALDNILLTMTGRGLDSFVTSNSNPLAWRRLSIATDQGSDMMSLWSYCAFKLNLCIDLTTDLSHGCHNDVKALSAPSRASSQ